MAIEMQQGVMLKTWNRVGKNLINQKQSYEKVFIGDSRNGYCPIPERL